jgi:hypothetical protein
LEADSFNITGVFLYEFFNWYENEAKNCFYCELEESSLEELHQQHGHINKRYPKRGITKPFKTDDIWFKFVP